jgi:hypothetical protein
MPTVSLMATKARIGITTKDRGPGGKRTRSERTNNVPVDDDEQTQIEVELASSGRSETVPKQGLVGAHRGRGQARGSLERDQPTPAHEPIGNGSEVAPTEKAAARERERHRLQRAVGVVPAGEDGNRRQLRAAGVKRRALDAAAREADRRVK